MTIAKSTVRLLVVLFVSAATLFASTDGVPRHYDDLALADDLSGPTRAKLGGALARLLVEHRAYAGAGASTAVAMPFVPSDRLMRIVEDRVVIDAVAVGGDAQALLDRLTALGLRHGAAFGRVVSGQFPIAGLDRLAEMPGLRFARPAYALTMAGSTTTQGDVASEADDARTLYTVDGTGVTVGVLSDSYDCLGGAAADVASGDLTTPVYLMDYGCSATDEGRVMLQIVHDLAPGASLAFETALNGTAAYATSILDLVDVAGADVLVSDVLYLTEPFFLDGIVARAVDEAAGKGAAFFSAAGNRGRQSYQATYDSSGASPAGAGDAHDFDAGAGVDALQSITIPAGTTVTFVLQWDEPHFSVFGAPGSANDLDLFLMDSTGTIVVTSSTDPNTGGDPVEVLGFTNPGPATLFNVVIENVAGPDPGTIKYVWYVGGASPTINEFDTASSTIVGHFNALGTEAVGAAFWDDTPAFGTSPPVVASGSGAGATPILFDSVGNRLAAPVLRTKPGIVCPDGGNNTFFGSDIVADADAFPNFFGTSAAAAHAGAIAALMLDAKPALTPGPLRAMLRTGAIDMDDPFTGGFDAGFDNGTGFGLCEAAAAVLNALECGNGSVQAPEECDDGNGVNGDGCDNNCTTTRCGNGIVTSGEQCDDANTNDYDACRNNCITPIASAVGSNPFSDDFNACTMQDLEDAGWTLTDPLGAATAIQNIGAGSGTSAYVKFNMSGTSDYDAWQFTGLLITSNDALRLMQDVSNPDCGNGATDPGEACDDGNTTQGDGCAGDCRNFEVEAHFLSTPSSANDDQGFMFQEDADTTLRIDVYHTGTQVRLFAGLQDGTTGTIMTCTATCVGSVNFLLSPATHAAYLRVARDAVTENWTVWSSPNGTAWTRRATFHAEIEVNSVGLYGGDPPAANDYIADLDYLLNLADPFMPIEDSETFTCPTCGDGIAEGGEDCDDGNVSTGDGCDATCEAEPCNDADGDGYGVPGSVACPNGDAEDCDDGAFAINPGATEVCDGDDNDCDTFIDEGFDGDGDTVADCFDPCPFDNPDDTDGDGVCDSDDICPGFDDALDADGDLTPDGCDLCPIDPLKVAPGTCGCGVADTDSDGDATPDCLDGCPFDTFKIAPGACGCGVADTDTDGDATPDCFDLCPLDPFKIAPGTCGCGVADTDTDGDTVPDCLDPCGDGVTGGVEECDDGNLVDTDACLSDCTNASCGDGFTWAGMEDCDDSGESPTCDADCTFAACGDGTLNASALEECDDTNVVSGDGCSATCETECAPGEFSLDGLEPCTPCVAGSFSAGYAALSCDACPIGTAQPLMGQTTCDPCEPGKFSDIMGAASCQTCSTCPFGTYESAVCTATSDTACSGCTDIPNCAVLETCTTAADSQCAVCDSGYTLVDGMMDSCVDVNECLALPCDDDASCTNTPGSFTCACNVGFVGDGFTCTSVCGDGIVVAGETCDDGNTMGGDGCSADCTSDETCGNGILDPGEVCDDGNTLGGDGCSADCTSDETCGNGVLDPGEVCDDGNTLGGDGCSADCTSDETCGNGILDPGEVCDDGNTLGGDGCSADCTSDETCGNGILDPGEVCDDGNTLGGDGCSADCTSDETCGNGILDPGEVCDDGNTLGGDGCSADCTSDETCGNGILDPGEVCDDGNNLGGDGCSADCTSDETCGNGILDPGETCDDGNTLGGDGCSADCTSDETCGNGVLDPGEACDDGNNLGGDGCSADCTSDETCGNGVLDPGETCDDGNNLGGDGCSADCSSDETCGNGILDPGEECDDGNVAGGDGCNATCILECQDGDSDGFGTPGDPSCPSGPAPDCNDGNPNVNPNALEKCNNNIDDDCDGFIDHLDLADCGPLAVRLTSFAATVTPDGRVVLNWQTALELDTVGFRILRTRNERKASELALVTPRLIGAQGGELQGASYEVIDVPPTGGTWVYYLESIDDDGTVERFGPVVVEVPRLRRGAAGRRATVIDPTTR